MLAIYFTLCAPSNLISKLNISSAHNDQITFNSEESTNHQENAEKLIFNATFEIEDVMKSADKVIFNRVFNSRQDKYTLDPWNSTVQKFILNLLNR